MSEKLTNPYITEGEAAPSSTTRIYADVSTNDYNLVRGIRPQTGTLSAVIGTLWYKLCYELKRQGITDWSRSEDFERFVLNCTIVDGRGLQHGAAGGTMSERTTLIGGIPTPASHVDQTDASKPTDVPQRSGSKRKGGKKETK